MAGPGGRLIAYRLKGLENMEPGYEWLNGQIDRMQADRALHPDVPGVEYRPGAGDLSMLKLAAQLNSMRQGASRPDPLFRSRLRDRLSLAGRADSGT